MKRVDLRAQIRASAVGLVPPQHIDEVVDLGMHAFERAFEVIGEVTTRGSSARVAMCATGIALSLIESEVSLKIAALQQGAKLFGMTTTTVRVGGQANG